MAKSLLHMISNDIGQLACLYAKLHNLSRVYFGGFFIRGHPVTMHTITYSINFFTKARPLFLCLTHEDIWNPPNMTLTVNLILYTVCIVALVELISMFCFLSLAVQSQFSWTFTYNSDFFFFYDLLLFCGCRVKFRPCFWDMKAILEPLERSLKEQRKIVRKKKSHCFHTLQPET